MEYVRQRREQYALEQEAAIMKNAQENAKKKEDLQTLISNAVSNTIDRVWNEKIAALEKYRSSRPSPATSAELYQLKETLGTWNERLLNVEKLIIELPASHKRYVNQF